MSRAASTRYFLWQRISWEREFYLNEWTGQLHIHLWELKLCLRCLSPRLFAVRLTKFGPWDMDGALHDHGDAVFVSFALTRAPRSGSL